MAELGAATGVGVREGKLTEKTSFGDSGQVEGSFHSAFDSPHRDSSLPDQAVPAVCWSGAT